MSEISELFDTFFNGRKAKPSSYPLYGGIDRKCPKCGVQLAHMRYDGVSERIELTCHGGCAYKWTQRPLDYKGPCL